MFESIDFKPLLFSGNTSRSESSTSNFSRTWLLCTWMTHTCAIVSFPFVFCPNSISLNKYTLNTISGTNMLNQILFFFPSSPTFKKFFSNFFPSGLRKAHSSSAQREILEIFRILEQTSYIWAATGTAGIKKKKKDIFRTSSSLLKAVWNWYWRWTKFERVNKKPTFAHPRNTETLLSEPPYRYG